MIWSETNDSCYFNRCKNDLKSFLEPSTVLNRFQSLAYIVLWSSRKKSIAKVKDIVLTLLLKVAFFKPNTTDIKRLAYESLLYLSKYLSDIRSK